MPYFDTRDGVRLYYQDWGVGPPVVFVSAWGLSSRMWQYQMVAMVDNGRRAIAYDRRGHGRSDQPSGGYDYDSLADDLAGLLDSLDLRDVTLVGHSMGAGELVRYVTRYGSSRVARLALLAPLGPFPTRSDDNPNGFDPAVIEMVRSSWKADFTAWLDAGSAGYVGRGLPGCDVSDGLVEWTRRDMEQASLHALLECNRTGFTTDLRPEMGGIDIPALVIHGDHDESIPVELSGRVCADLLPNATFILYENAPHGLYLTHRQRLNDDLLAFMGAPRETALPALS